MIASTRPAPTGLSCPALEDPTADRPFMRCHQPAVAWVGVGAAIYPACEQHARNDVEPEQALVGSVEFDGISGPEVLRINALEQAVRAGVDLDPKDTVARATAFLAFLAADDTGPAGSITLTAEEAEHAADWHDYVIDQGGEVPDDERQIAVRLRAAANQITTPRESSR